jgi:diguanylate cyclase (GGDEF)-like protein
LDTEPASKNDIQPEETFAQAVSIRDKIDIINQLAWKLRIVHPERARGLSKEAASLAKSGTQPVYDQGFAASLVTLAFLDSEDGDLESAISLCLKALSLLKDDHTSDHLITAWYTLGWSYYYSGDFPAALEYGLKALNRSEEVGFKQSEAWALDLAASTFKDPTQAIPMYQKALRIFGDLNDREGQARVLNNLACTLVELKDYHTALEYSQKSLQLAKDAHLKRDEINITGTIGEILLAMEKYDQAKGYLQQAKLLAERYGRDISYLYILVDLGEVSLAQNDFQKAEQHLFLALDTATKWNLKNEKMRCHQFLSELYEKQGKPDEALGNYKLFHSLKESIAGERSARQIAILKMNHQVETTQRDMEIQLLQNAKLQLEIDEQRRIQSILENLATRDSLTNLYNRRHFLTLAEYEWKRALRYGSPFSVLMLDLDDFKQINDRFGHAAGDQALIIAAGLIQGTLRKVEIAGRYGGDEFVVILPETPTEKGLIVGKRIHDKVVGQSIKTNKGLINLAVSIGVAGFSNDTGNQVKSLEELLHRADLALYQAKDSGKNQVSIYAEK